MSIDLTLKGAVAAGADALLAEISDYGEKLLGCPPPDPKLVIVTDGQPTGTPALIGVANTMLVMSWAGTEDRVAIVTVEQDSSLILTYSVGATRGPTEYVLGLVGACSLANLWGSTITDDNQFWLNAETMTPSEILTGFGVVGVDFQDACDRLLRRRHSITGGESAR